MLEKFNGGRIGIGLDRFGGDLVAAVVVVVVVLVVVAASELMGKIPQLRSETLRPRESSPYILARLVTNPSKIVFEPLQAVLSR